MNKAIERFPKSKSLSSQIRNAVQSVTSNERLIERRTVGEILVGRRVPLLDTIDAVTQPLRMAGLALPEYGTSVYKMKNNNYGFLAMLSSEKGPFEVFTGMEDTKFSYFATYRNKR